MTTNTQILEKAEWTLADLQSEGGVLPIETQDQMIQIIVDQPTVMNMARIVPMNNRTMEIPKIGFGGSILKPSPASGTRLSSGDRSRPTTSLVTLSAVEMVADVPLPYDIILNNVERGNYDNVTPDGALAGSGFNNGGIQSTLIQLMMKQVASDLEFTAIQGDTGSGNALLAVQDGWLKLSNVQVSDEAGAAISRGTFKRALQSLPEKYVRDLASMRSIVGTHQLTEYRDTLASRETILGDSQINGIPTTWASGIPVVGASLMPSVSALLTNPQNLLVGIQRNISIEVERRPSERQFIVVVTLNVAYNVQETDAVVRIDNILAV